MAHGYWLAGGAGNFGSWLRYVWCNFNNFLQISVKSLMKLIGMYSLSKRMLVPQKNARNLWCTSQRHHLQRQHQCMQTVLAESIVFTCATGRCFGKTERLKDWKTIPQPWHPVTGLLPFGNMKPSETFVDHDFLLVLSREWMVMGEWDDYS